MRRLITAAQTVAYQRLAESTIYKMVSRRDIPFLKIGTRVILDLDVFVEVTDNHLVMPVDSTCKKR
jgi:hypothetical protein